MKLGHFQNYVFHKKTTTKQTTTKQKNINALQIAGRCFVFFIFLLLLKFNIEVRQNAAARRRILSHLQRIQ